MSERRVGAASAQVRKSTIVARGRIDGARCVDMLIDTGASCCFVRRGWAESMKLELVPLADAVTVTLADRRTTVATHEVLASSMCVHGSAAACSLLVMDELSNDVIVGLSWQRAAGLSITPGSPDLLNGTAVQGSNRDVADGEYAGQQVQSVRLTAVLRHLSAAIPAARAGTGVAERGRPAR